MTRNSVIYTSSLFIDFRGTSCSMISLRDATIDIDITLYNLWMQPVILLRYGPGEHSKRVASEIDFPYSPLKQTAQLCRHGC